MTEINPYVNFNGNCREAMTFYQECLGGELHLQTVGGSPIESQCPTGLREHILHAELVRDGLLLMGSDMIAPEGFRPGNNMALSLTCSSPLEIEEVFTTLSRGGSIIHPLNVEDWGATFGVLKDQFGIRWMLSYDETLQSQLN